MTTGTKITYVSIGSTPGFDEEFEAALAAARAEWPVGLASSIDGAGGGGPELEVRSPVDRRIVVARMGTATEADVARAFAAAEAAFPAWRALGWQRRIAILREAAERIVAAKFRTAALMVHEIGKTRLEAMAEVEEAADLLRYYAGVMEEERGYRRPMARVAPGEATESVLLPYGVFAVISPFNFPMALAAGMVGAALAAGNTVVFKPSEEAPISGAALCAALWAAGVPRAALHLLLGTGAAVGAAMVGDPRAAGVAFTGSYEVGMRVVRGAAREVPRPVVVEMGGKNPAVVTAAADVEAAAIAVARSAFGYGGQKCSACSRVYVERAVAEELTRRLVAEAEGIRVGDPARRDTFLGPLVDARAVARYRAAIDEVRAAGGEILAGGRVLDQGDLAHGFFVAPTVARLPRPDHRLFQDELFLPLLLVQEVAGLDEALALANRSRFGLTAGLFSRDAGEVRRFLDGIEAGVCYVNRRSGATTGAWPGINPFGGWKGSGSGGPAALGPHYLLKFLREQSRTVNDVEL
jgi:1-pyrroline-5-carboxylate dehydrogenase